DVPGRKQTGGDHGRHRIAQLAVVLLQVVLQIPQGMGPSLDGFQNSFLQWCHTTPPERRFAVWRSPSWRAVPALSHRAALLLDPAFQKNGPRWGAGRFTCGKEFTGAHSAR